MSLDPQTRELLEQRIAERIRAAELPDDQEGAAIACEVLEEMLERVIHKYRPFDEPVCYRIKEGLDESP